MFQIPSSTRVRPSSARLRRPLLSAVLLAVAVEGLSNSRRGSSAQEIIREIEKDVAELELLLSRQTEFPPGAPDVGSNASLLSALLLQAGHSTDGAHTTGRGTDHSRGTEEPLLSLGHHVPLTSAGLFQARNTTDAAYPTGGATAPSTGKEQAPWKRLLSFNRRVPLAFTVVVLFPLLVLLAALCVRRTHQYCLSRRDREAPLKKEVEEERPDELHEVWVLGANENMSLSGRKW